MEFNPAAQIRYAPVHRTTPLRIAVVTETYPPEVNGVAMTIARVVKGLVERGHEVQLIRPRQGDADSPTHSGIVSNVLTRGLPIPRYPELKIGLPAGRRLGALWDAHRPDIVHVATEGPLGWSALQAAVSRGIPVASEFRTNFHAYTRHYGIGWLHHPIKAYLRLFHNRTGCTMVPTRALAGELKSDGFANLEVVARGVDTQRFDPIHRNEDLRRSWGADPGTLVAIAVGRLAPEKNPEVLQAAYQAMQERNPNVKLVVVGDGPARAAFRSRCPDAVFAGNRFNHDLAVHYASADLLLFPSVTETYGNVTPEAMSSGLAVMAYNYAAAAELIRHGKTGWLARFDDRQEFVALAARAAAEPIRVRQIGSRARAVAMSLDWDRILSQIEGNYRSLLRSSPASVESSVPEPVLAQ
ncbi:MAG: glycosyltransferase family 1 protein [Verrucomicrobiales bacterium]|nr:glycosyltransferase family 1 protein [Verrucomicrobiales bacterium]